MTFGGIIMRLDILCYEHCHVMDEHDEKILSSKSACVQVAKQDCDIEVPKTGVYMVVDTIRYMHTATLSDFLARSRQERSFHQIRDFWIYCKAR